jgi:hypothetical protein
VDEKIPSYKYKFKQIFKKIGQAKIDLFYFVAVLTWTVKVKNKLRLSWGPWATAKRVHGLRQNCGPTVTVK